MAISTNDLKNGMTLDLPEGLFQVVEFQHVKPGKGGAFVRTTLKNVRTGAVLDQTFRAAEKVEQAVVDKREMQFLYRDGDDFVFMDNATYDQLHVAAGGHRRRRQLHRRRLDRRPPAVQRRDRRHRHVGRRSSSRSPTPSRASRATACRAPRSRPRSRPAPTVQVPLFINVGDQVKVDTRSGEYISKA